MPILVLIGRVFVIILEMFNGRISLNSVLLLLVNFVGGFRFALMYISIIENIRSSLTHLEPHLAAFAAAIVHRNRLEMYQKDKSSNSKVKFRQASNHYKRVLEAAKLAHANKTKEPITSQKLDSRDFWRIANSVLKVNLLYPSIQRIRGIVFCI